MNAVADGRGRRVDARRNLTTIVEAAAELLARQPRASMQEVAAAAGVHRATVHRHFAVRDDLLVAVRDHVWERCLEAMRAAEQDLASDPAAALERLIRGQLELQDHYRIYRYVPVVDDRTAVDRPSRLNSVAGTFARAQEAGAARTDLEPAELAIVLSGLVQTLLPEIAQGRMDIARAASLCRRVVAP